MFGDESLRLLRTSWPSVDMLAEELYAIFRAVDAQPTQLQGPVTIENGNSSEPALTTNPGNGGNGSIQVPTDDGPPFIIGGGGFIGSPVIFQPIQESGGGGGGSSSSSNLTMPGQVVSGGPGTGPYQVKIFPNGLNFSSTQVPVTQLSIDSGTSVPAGTAVFVTQTQSGYYMQAPVWGAPVT